MKSLSDLCKVVDDFCEERGWNHSDPNQLIASTLIELGELAEHYQWKKEFPKLEGDDKREVAYEFVDVLFYLIRLANNSEINLEEAFEDKLPRLAKKFPVGSKSKEQNRKYRDEGRNKLYD